jgi:adenylate cyclase
MGIMSAALREPERAAASAQKALDLSPSFALGWLLLGMGRLFAGRPAHAIDPLQRGLRLSPHDPQAFIWLQLLAFAHHLDGAHEAAAQHAGEAVAMRPESASGQAILASSLAQLGREAEARRVLPELERALAARQADMGELLLRFADPADRERVLAGLRMLGWNG